MTTIALRYFVDLARWLIESWNRFWFSPRDPATLAVIRILAGAMLLYTHAVWTLGLSDFMGAHPWVPRASADFIYGNDPWAWSFLWYSDSPALLRTIHVIGLAAMTCLTLGLATRVASVVTFVVAVAYANRTVASQFGLDQINVMLAMYLMIGPAGACYSVDRLIRRWRHGSALPPAEPSITANIAIRLIQLHMCVIYFNAGVSKLLGPAWWDGSALWGAFANLEYQSLDMTWLHRYPFLVFFMTHVTIVWEISFSALVWNRMLRPLVLLVAIPLHLGIAFCMGMITFGFVMLYGCLAFVEPWIVRGILERRWPTGPGLPSEASLAAPPPGAVVERTSQVAETPLAAPRGRRVARAERETIGARPSKPR